MSAPYATKKRGKKKKRKKENYPALRNPDRFIRWEMGA